jgi:hypothetical protein
VCLRSAADVASEECQHSCSVLTLAVDLLAGAWGHAIALQISLLKKANLNSSHAKSYWCIWNLPATFSVLDHLVLRYVVYYMKESDLLLICNWHTRQTMQRRLQY